MRIRRWIMIAFPVILISGLYFAGPAPNQAIFNETFPEVPAGADELEQYILENESRHRVKPDNEARIIWHNSTHNKTEYAVVYLHGFSASQKEGDPVHRKFASEFGCNLFLSRLSDHGIDTTESLMLFTAERVWNSAKEALAIGLSLGHKVVIMSTSTGGTLALMLAARYPEKVHALINLSPNIAINNPAAFLLNDPWGLYIARMVMGGKYRITGADPGESKYWNKKYRLESAVQLQELIESGMTEETFKAITQPSLTLYYYKSADEQDPEVKVSAMLEMNEKLSTPDSLKVTKAIPGAGAHVIGSSLTSEDVDAVYAAVRDFASHQLKMTGSPTLAIHKNVTTSAP